MKRVKQTKGAWQYLLNPTEVSLLKSLLRKFPLAGNVPVKITKTDTDPKATEREHLLNESLAEHRQELKRQAMRLLGAEKFRKSENEYLLTLTAGERETLLQILNDLRVGCWVSLGRPESLEHPAPAPSAVEFAHHSMMSLAGYFEHHRVDQECPASARWSIIKMSH